MPWDGWPFARVALLFVGVAYITIWIQVYLFHLGGAFHKTAMWGPVLFGPILAITGLVLGIVMTSWLAIIGYVIFALGAIAGLVGAYYHWSAVGFYVLGYRLRNFIVGPPPMLPVAFAAISILGILAIYWHQSVR